MYFQQQREMVPLTSQTTVAVCNRITLLILYYITSNLATFLKVTDAPIQVPDIFDLSVSFKWVCRYMDWIGLAQDRYRWLTLVSAVMNLRVLWNARNFLTSCKPVSFSRRTLHHGVSKLDSLKFLKFSLRICILFFPKCRLASRLTLFRLSTLLWFGSCTHCILACFFCSKKNLSILHQIMVFAASIHTELRLSLVDVLIFSSMFCQALSMSPLSLNFSKAVNLFVLSIWYCFLASSSFSFLTSKTP